MCGERKKKTVFRSASDETDEEVGDVNMGMDKCCQTPYVKPENDSGEECERYSDVFLFIPELKQIIRIAEGNGSNLLPEDTGDGYVDYIYYDQYELGTDIAEVDGGQILLEEMLRDKYGCMEECIPDVLDMAYGNRAGYIILK